MSRTTAGPASSESPQARFARGVRLIDTGQLEAGQFLIDATALSRTALGDYALYYKAVALLGLSRYVEAESALTLLQANKPQGYVKEALALRLAQLALARADAKRAVDILEHLTNEKLSAPEDASSSHTSARARRESTSSDGATRTARPSGSRSASRFGTSSPSTSDRNDTSATTRVRLKPPAWLAMNGGMARSSGSSFFANEEPPMAPVVAPMTVIPI